MELGDLHTYWFKSLWKEPSRNPRYNGIGWFTIEKRIMRLTAVGRNPRYNGIGWFTELSDLLAIEVKRSQSSL